MDDDRKEADAVRIEANAVRKEAETEENINIYTSFFQIEDVQRLFDTHAPPPYSPNGT